MPWIKRYKLSLSKSVNCLILLLSVVGNLHAQEQYIEIEVRTSAAPKSALGIIFDSQKITQQVNTQIEKVSDNLLLVKIPFDRTDTNFTSGFATAYVLTENSELIFGATKMLPPAGDADSIWKLPACTPKNKAFDVGMPLHEQVSYLDSLFQIRLKKRELLLKDLQERLDSKTLNSLQQIEDRFGLRYDKSLSEESNAFNLHLRLRRLRETIQLYKRSKSKI